jgi:hypothetical protein
MIEILPVLTSAPEITPEKLRKEAIEEYNE